VVILPHHKNLLLLALTLEAVLGNKEFEFVVSEATLTVVSGLLDKSSLLLHVSFERVIEKNA
jgi:hypothetical protein